MLDKLLSVLITFSFWVLWTIILFVGIFCLYGVSLFDPPYSYFSIIGAIISAIALMLLMEDNSKDTYYDR